MSGKGPELGCLECRSSRDGLEDVGGELCNRAFRRVSGASYQNDIMHRCPGCGTRWLQQYWEIDTSDTAYEEFGERYEVWTALEGRDVAVVENAVATGALLSHDQFLMPRPATPPDRAVRGEMPEPIPRAGISRAAAVEQHPLGEGLQTVAIKYYALKDSPSKPMFAVGAAVGEPPTYKIWEAQSQAWKDAPWIAEYIAGWGTDANSESISADIAQLLIDATRPGADK